MVKDTYIKDRGMSVVLIRRQRWAKSVLAENEKGWTDIQGREKKLTQRQEEIVRFCLGAGTAKAIGDVLGISPHTVRVTMYKLREDGWGWREDERRSRG